MLVGISVAAAEPIRLGTTTTVRDSGLLDYLLDRYRAETGEIVIPVVAGTGLILAQARRGDFDVTLTHDPAAEAIFLDAGFGSFHAPVMANDFVIVGPPDDPAGISGLTDRVEALKRIADRRALFVSRGDDSGTHRRERALWQGAGINPAAARAPWYIESGAGMGTTLNLAAQRQAYVLTDLGTWLAYRARGKLELAVDENVVDNYYQIIVVDPTQRPKKNYVSAMGFAKWLTSEKTKQAIGAYRIDGQPAYFPPD